ncbi:hypothetical protein VCHA47P369_10044 [Vibrio chagasii]|nr:hypothetical protein VCHA30O60_10581 [Vibrio chagasii]CAH6872994.1 hypothetical protein VCHA34P121_20044 [Vibrio chagasii]CAH6939722.1 hypothetical protein VCHA34P115_40044 [Vibrio chagasii]CAH6999889.1 hypothetical protein VCHA47P369_10044 [Vibrio chagasii]CAH7000756.1 hypothetical protein VCHA51O448_140048 [Vibrio chagasii]
MANAIYESRTERLYCLKHEYDTQIKTNNKQVNDDKILR